MTRVITETLEGVANAAGRLTLEWAVPVHKPFKMQRMAAEGNSLVLPPAADESSRRYRGPWTNGTLTQTWDFSSSTLPVGWTAEVNPLAPSPTALTSKQVGMAVAQGTGKPGLPYAWQLDRPGGGTVERGHHQLTLNLAGLPSLAGRQATMMRGWWNQQVAQFDRSNSFQEVVQCVRLNGAIVVTDQAATLGQRPWSRWEVVRGIGTASTLSVGWGAHRISYNTTNGIYTYDESYTNGAGSTKYIMSQSLAGVELYSRSAADAYSVTDVVTHQGALWLCLANNTADEPGISETWQQIEGFEASTAYPELRVYRNGTLVDSSGNANADTSEVTDLDLFAGEVIRAEWAKCTAGARMRLTISGWTAE